MSEHKDGQITHKINGHSAYEAARGLEFQRSLFRGKVSEKMTREEMIDRMILIKDRVGEISENSIKQDSVLIWYDVLREFGSTGAAKKAVKKEICRRESATESGKNKMTKDEFKKAQMAIVQAVDVQETKEEVSIVADADESSIPEEKEEAQVIVKRAAENKTKKDKRSIGSNRYTDEEIYQILLSYARELGDVPKFRQIAAKSKSDPDFPSISTVERKVHFDWRVRIREELGLSKEKPKKTIASQTEELEPAEVATKPAEVATKLAEATLDQPEEQFTKPAKSTPAPFAAFFTTDAPTYLETELSKWIDAIVNVSAYSSNLDASSAFQLKTRDVQIDITLSARKP